MMMMKSLPLLWLLSLHRVVVCEPEPGFDLLFQSNSAEFDNVPVRFTQPLPAWLNGTYVRNGPGQFEFGPRSVLHLMDGYAKLSMWKFQGNRTATFSHKFVRSQIYKASVQANTIVPSMLLYGVKPEFGKMERLMALMQGMDNLNVNVYGFLNPDTNQSQFGVFNDLWKLYEISLQNLSTLREVTPIIERQQELKFRPEETSGTKFNVGVKQFTGQGRDVADNDEHESFGAARSQPYSADGFAVMKITSLIKNCLFVNIVSSAHPLPEPGTNNHLDFLLHLAVFSGHKSEMSLFRMTSIQTREEIIRWQIDTEPPYMHSFSVTGSKVILLASPFYTASVACLLWTNAPFPCLKWEPNHLSRLYIIDLKSPEKVQTILLDPPAFVILHHINAYHVDEHTIVLDGPGYDSTKVLSSLLLETLRDPVKRNAYQPDVALRRITIDLHRQTAWASKIDPGSTPSVANQLDMPAINEAYRGRKYCYVYGYVLRGDNHTYSYFTVVKKDVCSLNGTGDKLWHVTGTYPLEPWFVADPAGSHEDDGVLLVPGHDGYRQRATLSLLDARTLKPLTQAFAPTYIPLSFHGRYFPEH